MNFRSFIIIKIIKNISSGSSIKNATRILSSTQEIFSRRKTRAFYHSQRAFSSFSIPNSAHSSKTYFALPQPLWRKLSPLMKILIFELWQALSRENKTKLSLARKNVSAVNKRFLWCNLFAGKLNNTLSCVILWVVILCLLNIQLKA